MNDSRIIVAVHEQVGAEEKPRRRRRSMMWFWKIEQNDRQAEAKE